MSENSPRSQRPPPDLAVLISLCCVRKGDFYLAVEERDGFYLPAGGVDFGEVFSTGAKREALEEAGIKITLTGILRIEHRSVVHMNRFRVVFAAEAENPEQQPKTVSDKESLRAMWLTTSEMATKKLRNVEALKIFEFSQAGAPVFPLNLCRGTDGLVNNKKRVAPTAISIAVIAKNSANLLALLRHPSHGWRVPSQNLVGVEKTINKVAEDLCKTMHCQLSGFLGLVQMPPRNEKGTQLIVFVFGAQIDEKSQIANGITLAKVDELLAFGKTDELPEVAKIASEFISGSLIPVPTSIIAEEGSPYKL